MLSLQKKTLYMHHAYAMANTQAGVYPAGTVACIHVIEHMHDEMHWTNIRPYLCMQWTKKLVLVRQKVVGGGAGGHYPTFGHVT